MTHHALHSPTSCKQPLLTQRRQVTDSRDQQQRRSQRRYNPASRFITVDNVLKYASDVPSMQQRGPPQGFRARPRSRQTAAGTILGSGRPSDLRALNGTTGMDMRPRAAGRLAALPNLPSRSTKVSEKLVLLPETVAQEDEGEDPAERLRRISAHQTKPGRDFDIDNELAPLLAK